MGLQQKTEQPNVEFFLQQSTQASTKYVPFLGAVWWEEKEWNLKPHSLLFGEVHKEWNLKPLGFKFHPNPLELEPPQLWGGSNLIPEGFSN